MKIGIITLATGKYSKYIGPFLDSFYKYFFPDYERVFAFATDDADYSTTIIDMHYQYFKHEPWPLATLNKPKAINKCQWAVCDCDIVFWADSDLRCIDYVT